MITTMFARFLQRPWRCLLDFPWVEPEKRCRGAWCEKCSQHIFYRWVLVWFHRQTTTTDGMLRADLCERHKTKNRPYRRITVRLEPNVPRAACCDTYFLHSRVAAAVSVFFPRPENPVSLSIAFVVANPYILRAAFP